MKRGDFQRFPRLGNSRAFSFQALENDLSSCLARDPPGAPEASAR